MAKICVEIEMDTDTGALTVYRCEPEPPEMRQGAQEFQDIESALQGAAQMLQSEPAGESELQAAMQGGYDKVRPAAGAMQGAGMQFAEE
jgi:hypothetical protein